MAAMLQVLPSELIARIVSFLPSRRDVGSCRLASRALHELASPFLLTSVVFALRLDTLAKLNEVLEHPYFSRHVTHLVYDASRYNGDLAINWNGYVSRCEDAPRRIVDPQWTARRLHDAEIIDALSNLELAVPGANVLANPPNDAGNPPNANTSTSTNTNDIDDGDEQDFIGMGRYYEIVYKMGCQRTFPDYYARHRAQVALQEKGICHKILASVLRLPKLRHVIFTDFRYLARHGETYEQLCHRLFGITLEPDHLGRLQRPWMDIPKLFEGAHAIPEARIESLRIGHHPFTSVRPIINSNLMSPEAPESFPLHLFDMLVKDGVDGLSQAFGKLKALGFAYEETYELPSSTVLMTVLGEAARNLQEFTLERAVDRNKDTSRATAETDVKLRIVNTHFPRLKYLNLRHLQLETVDSLQYFLARHAHTLREVRLIEACLTDRGGEQDKLAQWAGQRLHLSGVEVMTAQDLQALSTFRPSKPGSSHDVDPEPILRRIAEREKLWLNGRSNSLGRSVDIAMPARRWKDFNEWWQQPAVLY